MPTQQPDNKKPRRNLSDDEELWRENLSRAWANRAPRITQAEAAKTIGFKGQSTISQYLNGAIPLNPKATIAFANCLGIDPGDINPELAGVGGEAGYSLECLLKKALVKCKSEQLAPEERQLINAYRALSKNGQKAVLALITNLKEK